MVLKLCGGLWPSSRTDDDVDAAVTRQRRLEDLLQGRQSSSSTSSSPPSAPSSSSSQAAKFAKEVRVVFDSQRPHGLVFAVSSSSLASSGYYCVVASIEAEPASQASEYNARCNAIGDYGHVILHGMCVRGIDHTDQKGVAYEDVIKRIETKTTVGCTITFADVLSTPLSPKVRLKAVGKAVALANQQGKMGDSKRGASVSSFTGPLSPSARRSVGNANASPKVSKWSSVLTAVAETNKNNHSKNGPRSLAGHTSQWDALTSDVTHKNTHLESQVVMLKARVATLESEKETTEKARDDATNETMEVLETLKREREQAQMTRNAQNEAYALVAKECEALTSENDALRKDKQALHGALDTLQHEHDALVLHMQEVRAELTDLHHHSEELHTRLVSTQLENHERKEQLQVIQMDQERESSILSAIQSELLRVNNSVPGQQQQQPRHNSRSGSSPLLSHAEDSPSLALLKRVIQSKQSLQKQYEELQIELSCHEATSVSHHEQRVEMEGQLFAVQQTNTTLKNELQAAVASQVSESRQQANDDVHHNHVAIQQVDLQLQLDSERAAKTRLEQALQALENKARAKLELHEKEQLFFTQFKELLVKGISVTKYGSRGAPHARVLYSDAQCRWLSWRSVDSGGGASSPKASAATASGGGGIPRGDAKIETIDLVEVLQGATTETFQLHKPEIPKRCLSLVACHPCRTLDLELENKDRALFVLRGFRLLLEEATEKRRRHQEEELE